MGALGADPAAAAPGGRAGPAAWRSSMASSTFAPMEPCHSRSLSVLPPMTSVEYVLGGSVSVAGIEAAIAHVFT